MPMSFIVLRKETCKSMITVKYLLIEPCIKILIKYPAAILTVIDTALHKHNFFSILLITISDQ